MLKYGTIQEASEAAIALGLSSYSKYNEGYKQDARLPSCPYVVYRDDWADFGRWYGFLGNEKKENYQTVQEASKAAIALGLTSSVKYKEGHKQDALLPTKPNLVYRDDWAGFGTWYGFLGNEKKETYSTIQEASKVAISLDFSSITEYKAGYKQDALLPSSPDIVYRDDWADFGGWYGFLDNEEKDTYPTIQEASKATMALGLTSLTEYRAGHKQDARLPACPHVVYRDGWTDFGTWYGFLGNEKKDTYQTIQEASKATMALGLTSIAEYKAGHKQDTRLPACPNEVYRDDWADFGTWYGFLGNEKKDTYQTIKAASKAAISLGLTSSVEYFAGYKQDALLPASPNVVYRDDWAGFGRWYGFLGNKKKDTYQTIQEASKRHLKRRWLWV